MNLIIKGKLNNKNDDRNVNIVYCELDNKDFAIPIIYIEKLKRNAFIQVNKNYETERLFNYVSTAYPNITEKEFGDYLLWKVYKYSRGRGLIEPEHTDLSLITPIF